jgi:hypothetical protein
MTGTAGAALTVSDLATGGEDLARPTVKLTLDPSERAARARLGSGS